MKVINGAVFDLERGFVEKEICTDGGLLAARSGNGEVLDASGCYVIPGLIDVHFHGCVGEDLSDASAEGLQRMADFELSEGVTYICPAGMTLPEEQLLKLCENAAQHRRENKGGAELVGLHLEGPFLSAAKKGAQNGAYLHKPDGDMLTRLQAAAQGAVRLVTVAPEEEGGLDFVRKARDMGVTVSVGHTTADYDTACAAFQAGASHVTHFYNGMPSLHHRKPSVIGAAFDQKHVRCEIICDGVHIDGSVIRLTFALMGAERMVLISDSLRCAGMPDGIYDLGGLQVEKKGKFATVQGSPDTLAGSVTSLMGCLRQAVDFGIPLADAVRAASYNPACAIGLQERIGSLEEGKEASFVLLKKEDLSIRKIVFKGNIL